MSRDRDGNLMPGSFDAADRPHPETEAEHDRQEALASMGPEGVPLADYQAYMDWAEAEQEAQAG